jgi:hypothetical protein
LELVGGFVGFGAKSFVMFHQVASAGGDQET